MSLERWIDGFKVRPITESEKLRLREEAERKYGEKFSGEVARLLDLGGTAFFDGPPRMRFMGLVEIVSADRQLGVDFAARRLIPLLDCYDNDFICYHLDNGTFCLFHLIDESIVSEAKTLTDLLRGLGYTI